VVVVHGVVVVVDETTDDDDTTEDDEDATEEDVELMLSLELEDTAEDDEEVWLSVEDVDVLVAEDCDSLYEVEVVEMGGGTVEDSDEDVEEGIEDEELGTYPHGCSDSRSFAT
jgi:hypothetical protein